MTFPTTDVGDASSKHSRLYLANNFGGFFTVASVSATTVTLDDGSLLTNPGNYTASEPGQLVVVEGQAGGDTGKVADVEGISGNDLTVDTDLTTALADGDRVAVLPPLSVELMPNGGHTIRSQLNRNEDRGLTETFLTHDTVTTHDVPPGDIPLFAAIDSPGLARLLLAFFGAYKLPGTSDHTFRFIEDDDGSFSELDEFCILSQDGNDVVREAFTGLFGQSLTIDVPRGDVATVSLTATGAEMVREIGGTGKAFTEGSGNWIRSLPCDTGKRHVAKGAFLELGGNFGDGLDKDAADRYFQSVNIEGTRGPTDGRPLGSPYSAKMEEFEAGIQVTGTRILQDDEITDDYYGGGAEPETPTSERLLLRLIAPSDSSKFLELDFPKGEFTVVDTRRQRGLFEQDFTYRATHTLDGNGCPDTSNPLVEVVYDNGDATDLIASV